MDAKLDCALDLLRRLPPQNIEKNLLNLVNLVPNICEQLLSSVDRPLKVNMMCSKGSYIKGSIVDLLTVNKI